ncbi:PLP-dependent aminotransferase family protein [Salinicoccus albus]|uniref:MocR-like transcriptional regulator GabR n=1 Tax=Salinicoccus albus TaxID=418756 RepID=UPI000361B74A|nr:PLP-dependent aminotransferase family protein [Salinicoccus albus]
MIIHIDKSDNRRFVYQQIYNELRDIILEKKLSAGDPLPPKRRLASELKVSINSVTNAYEQLLAEGYIYSKERSGYYVEDITQFTGLEQSGPDNRLPKDLKEERVQRESYQYSLSHMSTNLKLFPFKAWIKSEKLAIEHHKDEMSDISHPQGPYMVRETIAKLVSLNRGVVCEPEQVVIGPGTQPLIRQVLDMEEFKNSTVGMENPGYGRMHQLFKDMNLDVLPVSLDRQGLNIDEVKSKKPNVLYITPSHQFPTGKIMTISRRIEILNWAAASGVRYVIEDDYDSEFKYGTDNIPSLQSLDNKTNVIYSGTFSKTLTSSLRISYLVLPPELLRAYRANYSSIIQGSSTLNLFTLHYFIKSGEYDKHLKRMNHYYEKIRSALVKEIKNQYKDRVEITDIPAGLHFIAKFKSGKSYAEVEQKAKAHRLELYTLERFKIDDSPTEEDRISLVIGFAKLQEEEIRPVVDVLKQIV